MTYKDIVKECTPKEDRLKNAIHSFISGGIIGIIAEILVRLTSVEVMLIIFIVASSILTGLGVFDHLVSICKMGLVIPITGFANSVTSSSLDYKHEGFITGIGANYLCLAGSVILYGIVASFILASIRGILCLL